MYNNAVNIINFNPNNMKSSNVANIYPAKPVSASGETSASLQGMSSNQAKITKDIQSELEGMDLQAIGSKPLGLSGYLDAPFPVAETSPELMRITRNVIKTALARSEGSQSAKSV